MKVTSFEIDNAIGGNKKERFEGGELSERDTKLIEKLWMVRVSVRDRPFSCRERTSLSE